jgi:hypothetical protein
MLRLTVADPWQEFCFVCLTLESRAPVVTLLSMGMIVVQNAADVFRSLKADAQPAPLRGFPAVILFGRVSAGLHQVESRRCVKLFEELHSSVTKATRCGSS